MNTRNEIGKFPDGRLKLIVHFRPSSNFWVKEMNECSWVPALDEAEHIVRTLSAINEANLLTFPFTGLFASLRDKIERDPNQ